MVILIIRGIRSIQNLSNTRKFPEWFLSLKSSHSPMKHMQFKAAQAILDLVQTTSYSRSSWDIGNEETNE